MSGTRHLCLIGLRCTGKSSVGRIVAARLGLAFCDLDAQLTRLHQAICPPPESTQPAGEHQAGAILVALGESAFRDLEQRALAGVLAREEPQVVAGGAGCVERAANRELLELRAACVWLRADLSILGPRLAEDPTFRPALEGSDPIQEMERVAERRTPLYEALADVTIDCGEASVESLAERVVAGWRALG